MLKTAAPNILLIVDDSPFDLKITSRIVGHAKLFKEIICFESAEEALDFLAENINNTTLVPQMILLDIQMPDMDGFEFMNRYEKFPKKFKDRCKVAMLSSTDDLTDIARAEADKNIIKLLKKPLQLNELKKIIFN